jgi:hypothetical protein
MGFIVYLMNTPTLSSSEAEYVAISEAFKEIIFTYFLPHDIGIDVELPIVAKTDNIGAMPQMHQRAYAHVTWILSITLLEKALKRAQLKSN